MLNNTDIRQITNKQEWESCLTKFDYTTMFLAWEWGQFEKSRGSDFEFYGIYRNGNLIGLLPIKAVVARRGKYLHVRHGPVIDWENTELVNLTMDFLKEKAKEKGLTFIRISPLIDRHYKNSMRDLGFKDATSHANDDELTVVIDLKKNEEKILSAMRKTTRNLIKRAEREGVLVKNCADAGLFSDFEKVYLDTVNRKHWAAYSTAYIEKEYKAFAVTGNARIFVSYYQNEPVSASVFIIHRNQVVYHYSGSMRKFRHLPAMYLLHWEAIKYFKGLGLEIYNFWGVCRENQKRHPWYGLSLFKRGFSNTELEFLHAQDLILRPFAHITRLYEWLEAKRRGYD